MTFDLHLLFYCEHFTFWWHCNVIFWWQRDVENKTKQRLKMFMVIIKYEVWNSILASNEMCSAYSLYTIFRLQAHTIWLLIKVMVAGNLLKDFIPRIDYKINIPPSPLLSLMSARASMHKHTDHTKQSAPQMTMTCLYNILKTTYSYQQTNNNKKQQQKVSSFSEHQKQQNRVAERKHDVCLCVS